VANLILELAIQRIMKKDVVKSGLVI